MDPVNLPDPSVLPDSMLLQEILATVRRTEKSVTEFQERVVKLEKAVDDLNKQVYDLQNIMNLREQQLRSRTVRVTGVPFTDEEKSSVDPKFLAKKVHEKLLLPILNQAKSAGQIERTPTHTTAVESCFRVRANTALTGTARPPPIILKFTSDQFKQVVMRNKRLHIPTPPKEEKDLGIQRYNIVEDLTPPAFKKLREVLEEESVTKAWTVNGVIKFTARGDTKVHTVKSVYDPISVILANIST